MTYRELLKQLKRMSDEQLDLTVTLKFEAPLADDPEFYELDIEPLSFTLVDLKGYRILSLCTLT